MQFCINSGRTSNATIEVIIEAVGFVNSNAGDINCPNTVKAITSRLWELGSRDIFTDTIKI
jgi:hypothetical protein